MRKLQFYIIFFIVIFTKQLSGQISHQDSLRIKGMAAMKADTSVKGGLQILDSLFKSKIVKLDSVKKPFKIIPRLATKKSAMVPGWGQIYIKQGWFVPVIYAGFGGSAFGIIWNGKRYRAFRNAYFKINEANDLLTLNAKKEGKSPVLLEKENVLINGIEKPYSIAVLKLGTNYYRRNRDLSWFTIPLVWAVNILEVNVAAHLKSFDMSDDITMKFEPSFTPEPFTGLPTLGGKVVFAFR